MITKTDKIIAPSKKGKEHKAISIKPLLKNFIGRGEVKGFEFIQISKTNRGFLYEVKGSGIKPHYEVFRRKINKRFGCESYPTSKAFGIWAWTYRDIDKAMKKFNELNNSLE